MALPAVPPRLVARLRRDLGEDAVRVEGGRLVVTPGYGRRGAAGDAGRSGARRSGPAQPARAGRPVEPADRPCWPGTAGARSSTRRSTYRTAGPTYRP